MHTPWAGSLRSPWADGVRWGGTWVPSLNAQSMSKTASLTLLFLGIPVLVAGDPVKEEAAE